MLEKILNQVADIQRRFARNATSTWFRGHRNSSWELKSTLHRQIDESLRLIKPPRPSERLYLRDEAKKLYSVFQADAWPLLRAEERSDWGVLFTMQHFSLPTRLLDWTESFTCALYFAQKDRQPNESAAVWVLGCVVG